MPKGVRGAQNAFTLFWADEIDFPALAIDLFFHFADLSGVAQARRPCRELFREHHHLVTGVDIGREAIGHIQQPIQQHVPELNVVGVRGRQNDIAQSQVTAQPLWALPRIGQPQLVQGIGGDIGAAAVGDDIDALCGSLVRQQQQQVTQGSGADATVDTVFVGR